jgi:hydrogenase nickel incorporation protein HypA/HybF
VHELSIAMSIVDLAGEEAARRNVRVTAVYVSMGPLSGVVKDALLPAFDMAAAGTALEGSRLLVEESPVVVFCPACREERPLASIQSFRCPECGTPTADVVRGAELQVTALEVEE